MVTLKHSLEFVTEVDETHPIGMQILALEKSMQKTLLENTLKEFLLPIIEPALDEVNEGGTYAILKVVK